MAKNIKVAEMIECGNLRDDSKDTADILEQCADLLDGVCSHEIIGAPILFKGADGSKQC